MKMLICSDGHPPAENAIRFVSEIAGACQAQVTLLGIVEKSAHEAALLNALRHGAEILRDKQIAVELVSRQGQPIEEIRKYALETASDLIVVGAERKGRRGPYGMSAKAYSIIKRLTAPVLIVIGARERLRRILLCSGGQTYIHKAVELTGQIAGPVNASVTILHVMAEPPPVYSDLIAEEENVEKVIGSNSILGCNLRDEKKALAEGGAAVDIHLRHGLVVSEIFKEIETGDYDLIVVGASLDRSPVGTYLLGDVTREIIDRTRCPVLVVRGVQSRAEGFFAKIARWLGGRRKLE